MEISVKTLLLLVSAGLAAAQTPTPVALVNPGFEAPYNTVNLNGGTITGQLANGWTDSSSYDNATVQYSQETTNPNGGASCQKIVVTNATMALLQKFQLRAGNTYTASVWMRGLPGTIGRLAVSKASSPYTGYLYNDVALTPALPATRWSIWRRATRARATRGGSRWGSGRRREARRARPRR